MTALYPLRMQPAFDPRPWGTTDLSPIYSDHKFEEKIGEAWLTGDDCKVANGPFFGRTLAELSKECGRALVGEAAPDPERFPLLLKFLFPHDKLSVQVHPDADSLDTHLKLYGERLAERVARAVDSYELSIWGAPSESTLAFLGAMPGLQVRVLPVHEGGFLRPQPL